MSESALAREKNGRLPDQRSGSRTQDLGARRSRRGRRGSAINQNENGRNTLVKVKCLLIPKLRKILKIERLSSGGGPGGSGCGFQSADNFVKLGVSQSDRMFVVRCSSWP